ncbi:SMC-Scp complex subunit ScpB [Tunturibacter empetritectus]|uniref:Segregation and condensation protein B n=2 Tax=Tunturiibacter empetritectus TaxID=3069691 RepID=A0A7W8MRX4_9BACT|nr:SMC-Scp complex subunit ScpB [Edaphobacter lichenicola]MBB5318296.1 segregation and condensation protein B [Edaphobacter lichenicola]
MSLKAKIEAVIYASEEPVTLAQLAGLLGHEAQAELDHLDSAQHSLALDDAAGSLDEDDLNTEVLGPVSHQAEPHAQAEPHTQAEPHAEAQPQEDEFNARHAEELHRHLHEAAALEAAHARALREHAAADAAAMSTADDLEADFEADAKADREAPAQPGHPAESAAEYASQVSEASAATEQGSDSPAEPAPADKDEKKLAREAREKERRLREYFRTILDQLIADYATSERGLEIREVAGGYRFATKPEYHDAVRGFVKSLKPPLKLSLQALETLAVVAYKQPVTAPEVSEIRGVDSGGVLGSLMTRKLVATAGRKQVIGRPILYKTTRDFLLRFGLKDINELPSIEEFEKMAGELAEQEEIPMEHHAPESASDLEREKNQTEPQADGDSNGSNDSGGSNDSSGSETTGGETAADEAIVDGRLSGLPPNYDTDQVVDGEDSPALDAEIQSEQRHDSEEG